MNHYKNQQKWKKTASALLCVTMLSSVTTGFAEEAYPETLVQPTGTEAGFSQAKGKFYPDYSSIYEARKASAKVTYQASSEGIILLKNENHALPLKNTERNVTAFGICSSLPFTGGGGAGNGLLGSYEIEPTDTVQGLKNGGLRVNPAVDNYYRANYKRDVDSGDTLEDANAIKQFSNTFYNYGDVAFVTIGRTGSEGSDCKIINSAIHTGEENEGRHYLELTAGEEELVRYAKANFDKVIVLLNTGNIMEVGQLNEPKTDDNLGVDAILWIGHAGNDQHAALGAILTGEISPSAHTADTWAADFTQDPSFQNFANNDHITDEDVQNPSTENGTNNSSLYLEDGSYAGFPSIEYREGIYMGYRYYETKYADMNAEEAGSGDSWYNEAVTYPFGYGLSYTDFDWEIVSAGEGEITAPNETVTVQVKVTNVGEYAGKDVVQMYVTPPYEFGGIEKAEVNLMDFAKTDTLEPGESQIVELQCVAQDFASFDWNDANGNGFVGYELEAGDYVVSIKKNAHDEGIDVVRTVSNPIQCATDYTTGNEIEAVFSQNDGIWAEFNSVNDSLANNSMSRIDGLELPKTATVEDRTISQAMKDQIESRITARAADDKESDYWYVGENGIPANWDQSNAAIEWVQSPEGVGPTYHRANIWYAKRTNPDEAKTAIQLSDMAGISYQDYRIDENNNVIVGTDEGSQKWEEFMNQLTWDEMLQITSAGGHGRFGVDSIGLPYMCDNDGSTQMSCFFGYESYCKWIGDAIGPSTVFPAGAQIGVTWNKELAYEIGRAMGNECLLLDYDGLYGYSVNTHRSPFGGRNYEYYSEDGVLAGKLVANATLGTTEKGITVFTKHIFLNEQETARSTVLTWCNEQAMREIYLKPYEWAIKAGHANGIMNSMSRIGTVKAYANGALHDGILHYEWNFKGITLTDAGMRLTYCEIPDLVRNGVDLPLGPLSGPIATGHEPSKWDPETKMVYVHPEGAYTADQMLTADKNEMTMPSPTTYYAVRRAAMHILYVSANSSGIKNGIRDEYNLELTKKITTTTAWTGTTTTVSLDGVLLSGYKLSNIEILENNLPEGVELDLNSGKISFSERFNGDTVGESKLVPGTYTVKIKCLVDDHIGLTRVDENGNEIGYHYEGNNGTVDFAAGTLGHRQEITFNITIQ